MIKKKYKDKGAEVELLRQKIANSPAIVVAEYRGLKAGQMVALRSKLREGEVELRVVKNNLLKRAAEGSDLAELITELQGPTAVAFGAGDAVQAAKLLAQGAKENDAFVLTNGIVAQMKVDGSGIEAIGKLPSQEELRAKTVGAIQGPLAGLVFTLRGALTAFAGTIQAKIDKESAAA